MDRIESPRLYSPRSIAGILGAITISPERLAGKYATAPSRFITINGLRVHYRDEGSGPVVLLIHGILSSLHTWDRWARRLRERYRVVRLDMPGHGLTGPANFEYSKENFDAFLAAFIAALKLRNPAVIGSSLGGYFAWYYAANHAADVRALVLIDPAAFPLTRLPLPVKLSLMPIVGALAVRATPRFIYRIILRQVYGDPHRVTDRVVDRYFEIMAREGNRATSRVLFRYLVAEGMKGPGSLIKRITCPTLLMWGGRDRWIPPTQLNLWKHELPDAEVALYHTAGHLPMEENPDTTVEDCLRFLASHRRRRR